MAGVVSLFAEFTLLDLDLDHAIRLGFDSIWIEIIAHQTVQLLV